MASLRMVSKADIDISLRHDHIGAMERKAFTLRLDEKLYSALSVLSGVVHRSMNELIGEAVSKYVKQESEAAAVDLEETLEKLRAYQAKDPEHKDAWAAFAKAEAEYADPLEGEVFIEEGSVQGQIRTLLKDA